jgi:HTH-type transcriptional regulator/antitoxin HigA
VDGAATMLTDGTSVIGLSLRHDRIDNFWFCRCNELAQIKYISRSIMPAGTLII